MTPASSRAKLTYDDFLLFPDDGMRHELIDGVHYVTASPNTKHQTVSGNIHLLIGMWLQANSVGRIYYAPFDVVFSKYDVVEPDLLYMSHERAAAVLTPANVQGAPELVIEIGSPSTRSRDESIKRELYDRAGVAEYWFVDPDADTIKVYRRAGEKLGPAEQLFADRRDVLRCSLFPGLELALTRIFADHQ